MILKREVIDILSNNDLVRVRQNARAMAVEAGFTLVEQTKIVTAASELARNAKEYGGSGTATLTLLHENARTGIELVFQDSGPGIADIDTAMRDGFSTSGGLGLGLGGSRRLMDDFEITSFPGLGTTVRIARWR